MSWQAILESASNADKVWDWTLGFTNGQEKFQRAFRTNSLTNAIVDAAILAEFTRLASVADTSKLTYQVGEAIVPVTVSPKPPTDVEIARAKFFADYRQLQAMLRAVDGGFIDAADKRIADLQTSTKSAWLDSYLGLV